MNARSSRHGNAVSNRGVGRARGRRPRAQASAGGPRGAAHRFGADSGAGALPEGATGAVAEATTGTTASVGNSPASSEAGQAVQWVGPGVAPDAGAGSAGAFRPMP